MLGARLPSAVIVLGIALAVFPVHAQVARSQTGRALDSNFRLGSGGINTPRGLTNVGYSQLYVTGQVTGLGGFHGSVGYRAPTQLGLDLPSSSLGRFRAQSVGVSDVAAGPTYRSAPYYERGTTVFGVREILMGVTAPGSSVPRRSVSPLALRQELTADATADYRSLAPGPRGMRVPVLGGPGGPARPQWEDGRRGPPLWEPSTDFRLGPFLRPQTPDETVQEFSDLYRSDAVFDSQVKSQIDPTNMRDIPLDEQQTRAPTPTHPQVPTEPTRVAFTSPLGEMRSLLPEPNEDVFVDLRLRLRERGVRSLREAPLESEQPEDRTGLPRVLVRRTELTPERQAKDLVVLSGANQVILRGLAGTRTDEFNKYMKQAQEDMNDARHYDASYHYELAAILDSTNPLPRLGKGLAYFGAAEPLSAGMCIRHAMEIFPAIMETQLDIPLIMDEGVFRKRLKQLDERLEKEGAKADPLLIFVGVFMHQSVGEVQIARRYAPRLKLLGDKDDRVFQSYVRFVLARRGRSRETTTSPVLPTPKR